MNVSFTHTKHKVDREKKKIIIVVGYLLFCPTSLKFELQMRSTRLNRYIGVRIYSLCNNYGYSIPFQGGASFVDPFCYLCFMIFVVFMVMLSRLPCSLVITCWERTALLALLCVARSLCFYHFIRWSPVSGVSLDCIDS